MNSMPVESFMAMDCGCRDFMPLPVSQISMQGAGEVSQSMSEGPRMAASECWQTSASMQVGHQGAQQMILVPVCFVSPTWMNSVVGYDGSGILRCSNMVGTQHTHLYQVLGPCSMIPGCASVLPIPDAVPSFNVQDPLTHETQEMPSVRQHVLHEKGTAGDAPFLESMGSRHEQLKELRTIQEKVTKHSQETEEDEEEHEDDSVDELSVSVFFDDKYDSRSFASSDASTAVSRSARRRRGRRAAKAKAKQEALSALPILEPPSLDEVFVTADMKKAWIQQLEVGGPQRRVVLRKISGSVVRLAFEPFGCRVVQCALDVAGESDKQALAAELHGHVREAISSPHANFVIQKMIEVLPISRVNFVVEELLTFAVDAARHKFACRILCRLIEHHISDKTGSTGMSCLIDELLPETEKLIRHNFARHVIELVLEHGNMEQQEKIIHAIRNDLVRNAKDRYASYVVEQVLHCCCGPEGDGLASDLIGDTEGFWTLANHECGCHVIKALLKSRGHMSTSARKLFNIGASELCTSKYGQRLLQEVGLAESSHGQK